jgi:hypothetical protein
MGAGFAWPPSTPRKEHMKQVTVSLIDGTSAVGIGEAILDAREGVLIFLAENGTQIKFNWRYVLSYIEKDLDE